MAHHNLRQRRADNTRDGDGATFDGPAIQGGDIVLVTGAAPECLNLRVKAGRENDAIVCAKTAPNAP